MRDCIHAADRADAHVKAMKYLLPGGESIALNMGTGAGHSLMEVIQAAENVTGRAVPHRISPRRSGDPAVLVAGTTLAGQALGWHPQHSGLDSMLRTAWKWHTEDANLPRG